MYFCEMSVIPLIRESLVTTKFTDMVNLYLLQIIMFESRRALLSYLCFPQTVKV